MTVGQEDDELSEQSRQAVAGETPTAAAALRALRQPIVNAVRRLVTCSRDRSSIPLLVRIALRAMKRLGLVILPSDKDKGMCILHRSTMVEACRCLLSSDDYREV